MRVPLIAGNWKMHNTLAEARELVDGIKEGLAALKDAHKVEVLVCPPYQLLFPMAKAVAGTRIMLGAQNAHEESKGAFTGEVSVPMLKDTGCTHIIVGHSERRQLFGETGDRLRKKVSAVTAAGLHVIYCVGETLQERESNQTERVVKTQLAEALSSDLPWDRLILAYEPVWAIGTGKTATPEQAQDVHRFIRAELGGFFRDTGDRVRILYGGSVKPANAAGLMAQPDIDGALVGGACLVASDFLGILSPSISAKR